MQEPDVIEMLMNLWQHFNEDGFKDVHSSEVHWKAICIEPCNTMTENRWICIEQCWELAEGFLPVSSVDEQNESSDEIETLCVTDLWLVCSISLQSLSQLFDAYLTEMTFIEERVTGECTTHIKVNLSYGTFILRHLRCLFQSLCEVCGIIFRVAQ